MTGTALVAGGFFVLVGAILLVVAGRHCARRLTFIRGSAVAAGVVIALREERDGMEAQTFRYPRVRFRTATGQEVIVESSTALGGRPWRIGEPVAVRYQVGRPHVAELDSAAVLWGPTVVFALLAAAFCGVGLGVLSGSVPL